MLDLLAQVRIFARQTFDFLSDQIVVGRVRHLPGQREFAVINVLPDQVGVVRFGPQLQIFFEMIDRRRPVCCDVLVVNQAELEVGNLAEAHDNLARAYTLEGATIFEGEDEKYLRSLRTVMRDI